MYFVGLSIPESSSGPKDVGTLMYHVGPAENNDTQVVTLSGQIYMASGEVVDLVPASVTFTVRASTNDADQDGIPDAWEMATFGGLSRNGAGDRYGDGLSDLQEYLHGTNPKLGRLGRGWHARWMGSGARTPPCGARLLSAGSASVCQTVRIPIISNLIHGLRF